MTIIRNFRTYMPSLYTLFFDIAHSYFHMYYFRRISRPDWEHPAYLWTFCNTCVYWNSETGARACYLLFGAFRWFLFHFCIWSFSSYSTILTATRTIWIQCIQYISMYLPSCWSCCIFCILSSVICWTYLICILIFLIEDTGLNYAASAHSCRS